MVNPLRPPNSPAPKPPEPYPITVKCIVDCLSDVNPEIVVFREYAHSLNITFVTREYDSRKSSEDRDYVTRLPAFHIYLNKQYKETFYPNTRPYQIMHDTVEGYKRKQQERRTRRTWVAFYREIRTRITSLFHRKTAMEKHQEERTFQKKRRVTDWS